MGGGGGDPGLGSTGSSGGSSGRGETLLEDGQVIRPSPAPDSLFVLPAKSTVLAFS
jgi:hypothetical protein